MGLRFLRHMHDVSYAKLEYNPYYSVWHLANRDPNLTVVTVDLDGLSVTFAGDANVSIYDMFDELHNLRVQARAVCMPTWVWETAITAWKPQFLRLIVDGNTIAVFKTLRKFTCNFDAKNVEDVAYKHLRISGTWLEYEGAPNG